jgi:MarR family transcriptional regulator, organic hydroperoxide resistance regulator
MGLEQVFRSLIRAEIGLWDAVDEALRRHHDLPLVQYLPMRVIEETSNCRVQDIAVALRITTGGTTQAVDRIVAAGYCNRRPNPADRRSSIIDLTEEGKSRLAAAASTLESELQARLSILPRRSINQLQEALKAIEK